MEISVVVLVYNARNFLDKCLTSVLCQTFTDFELLLINDGSSDDSMSICKNYQEKDNRVKIFDNKHQGISASREFGLNQASGEYIIFIDSDDWIEPDMLEKMYNQAKKENYDVISCSFDRVYPEEIIPMIRKYDNKESFLQNVICDDWAVLWKLLVKKSLYTDYNIHFPPGVDYGEDYVVVIKLLYFANKISSLKDILYHYNCSNQNSFTKEISIHKLFFPIHATKIVESFFEEQGKIQLYEKELNLKKRYVKEPLKAIDYALWRSVFPEINYYIDLDNDGKVRAFIRKVLHKLSSLI